MSTNFPPVNPGIQTAGSPVASNGATSPIADLSYRTYDGPLKSRAVRWWIVALAGLRINLKKPGYWLNVAAIFLPCLFTGVMLYFMGQVGQMARGGDNSEVHTRFARSFFQLQSWTGILMFSLALVVGTSIASDNRSNALLVYLSKPITRGDYLLGKWAAIFLLIFGALAVPALLLYLFCLTLFLKDGFLSNEPWLILHVLLACSLPAALYASIMVGLSAWSKSPSMANAVMAGLYFVTILLSVILFGIFVKSDPTRYLFLRHASLGGMIQGLLQHIYGITDTVGGFRGGPPGRKTEPGPPLWPLLAAAGALSALGIAAAYIKVRAVEVVRG